jgi:hypothetical protein
VDEASGESMPVEDLLRLMEDERARERALLKKQEAMLDRQSCMLVALRRALGDETYNKTLAASGC